MAMVLLSLGMEQLMFGAVALILAISASTLLAHHADAAIS
jgi:hypothetical protein